MSNKPVQYNKPKIRAAARYSKNEVARSNGSLRCRSCQERMCDTIRLNTLRRIYTNGGDSYRYVVCIRTHFEIAYHVENLDDTDRGR